MAEIAEIVREGDYRASLEALRDKLAAEIDDCHDGTKVAALAKQLRDVLNTLKSMPSGKERSVVDELAARRAASRPAVPPPPAVGDDRGPGGN